MTASHHCASLHRTGSMVQVFAFCFRTLFLTSTSIRSVCSLDSFLSVSLSMSSLLSCLTGVWSAGAMSPRRRSFVAGGGLLLDGAGAARLRYASGGCRGSPSGVLRTAAFAWTRGRRFGLARSASPRSTSFATGALILASASGLRRRGERPRRALHRLGSSRRRGAPDSEGSSSKINYFAADAPSTSAWNCRGDSADWGFGTRSKDLALYHQNT